MCLLDNTVAGMNWDHGILLHELLQYIPAGRADGEYEGRGKENVLEPANPPQGTDEYIMQEHTNVWCLSTWVYSCMCKPLVAMGATQPLCQFSCLHNSRTIALPQAVCYLWHFSSAITHTEQWHMLCTKAWCVLHVSIYHWIYRSSWTCLDITMWHIPIYVYMACMF